MLNEHERNEGEGPEDGEYHFSDEGGYEVNAEEEEAKAPELGEHGGLAQKLSSYRRFVIIGAVFAAVLLVTYLLIPPLTTTPSTDITAVANPPAAPVEAPLEAVAPKPAPVVAPVPKLVKEVAQPVPAESVPTANPAAKSGFANMLEAEKEKIMAEKNAVMTRMRGVEAKTVAPPSVPSTVITVPPQEAAAAPPAAPPAIGSEDFVNAPVSSLMSATQQDAQVAAANKANLDRLEAMQEANTKVIGQMQAQYSQRLADYEVRDKALQEQVLTLTTRLSGMEAQMNKLVMALNRQHQAPPSSSAAETTVTTISESNSPNIQSPVMVTNGMPGFKSGYSVQAIIPGRAWLRTDGGETITVAEGDVLKSLGKVTKIDPYDGTIQVDTGSRVITLTYGNGEYS